MHRLWSLLRPRKWLRFMIFSHDLWFMVWHATNRKRTPELIRAKYLPGGAMAHTRIHLNKILSLDFIAAKASTKIAKFRKMRARSTPRLRPFREFWNILKTFKLSFTSDGAKAGTKASRQVKKGTHQVCCEAFAPKFQNLIKNLILKKTNLILMKLSKKNVLTPQQG